MLSLSQRLSQTQKLSPQQIQYQKLLQLNTLALEQRIKTELELNPILEETLEEDFEITQEQTEENSEDTTENEETVETTDDEFDVEDYMNDDSDIDSDRLNRSAD